MFDFSNFNLDLTLRILRTILIVFVIYFGFQFFAGIVKKRLIKRAKTKRERTNIEVFFDIAYYVLILLLAVFAILSYVGSLGGIGIVAGLLSAALGWALQKPITGIAGWIMLVVKRPFEIGDRVIIAGVRGDVIDITLTHIHIAEIGGTIPSEESSGRIVLIPNAKLFEENIVNYTKQDKFVLDEVKFSITFESNLKKATQIAINSAKEVLKNYIDPKRISEIYCRTWFQPNGVDVYVRYNTLALKRNEISSEITKNLFAKIQTQKGIRFAYPHTEVLISKEKIG